jgi:hypothetical protein
MQAFAFVTSTPQVIIPVWKILFIIYYYWWGGTESLGICSSPYVYISPWYCGHFALLYKPR